MQYAAATRQQRRFPAQRYVIVDDKPDILSRVKRRWGEQVLTVHVQQGKYAEAPLPEGERQPDRTVENIGALLRLRREDFE